jgi:hypothetical protein
VDVGCDVKAIFVDVKGFSGCPPPPEITKQGPSTPLATGGAAQSTAFGPRSSNLFGVLKIPEFQSLILQFHSLLTNLKMLLSSWNSELGYLFLPYSHPLGGRT